VADAGTFRWLGASLLAGGLVATVIVMVVVVLGGGSDTGVAKGGPLAEPGFRMGETAAIDVGKSGTYGMETITNHGRATAVLDRIAFVDRSSGLEILGPLVMHLRDQPGAPALAAGLIRRFPPPHDGVTLHRLAGFRIAPHRSWRDDAEVLIGFRAHRTGVLFYRALELYYHVGKKRYVAAYPDPLTICAPYSFPLSRCKPP
jgi:hypothetical protein